MEGAEDWEARGSGSDLVSRVGQIHCQADLSPLVPGLGCDHFAVTWGDTPVWSIIVSTCLILIN